MLTLDKNVTRGIAESPRGVVVSTAGGLRFHPVKVVVEPRGRRESYGCAGSKRKRENEQIT